jgi:hypothetical protein
VTGRTWRSPISGPVRGAVTVIGHASEFLCCAAPLVAADPVLAAKIDIIDGRPPVQTRLADPQTLRDLRDWLITSTGQLDSTTPELQTGINGPRLETIIASQLVSGRAGQAPLE